MSEVPEWQRKLEIVSELMRDVSRQTDPQELVRIYAAGVRRLYGSDRLVSMSRRGLEAPWYRVTRDSREADPVDPWLHRERLPLFREGLLGELLYSGEPRVIMDLKVSASDPTRGYFEGMRALYTLPQWEDGVAVNMSLRMYDDPARLDVTRYPDVLWQSNLFGRTTANLVLRRELRQAYDKLDREMKIVGGHPAFAAANGPAGDSGVGVGGELPDVHAGWRGLLRPVSTAGGGVGGSSSRM